MITLSIQLPQSANDIERDILAQIAKTLNKALKGAVPAIKKRVQDMCDALITRTEEYKSLLTGELLGELGIPDVEMRLREILDAIRKGVEVNVRPVTVAGGKLKGGLTVSMLRADFEDILGLPAASYVSNDKYNIPWLEWLITGGDQILVFGYDVTFDLDEAARNRSRTGLALMIPQNGSGWRVPSEYSGTLENNFLTRSFDEASVLDLAGRIMREEIQRRIA